MLFSEVIGQNEIKQRLIQTIQDGRIAHAQLFWGNEGCGTLPLALALAQYIFCQNRTDEDACGVCPSCNKMQKLIHPDLHFVVPVNSTEKISADKKPVTDHFIQEWRNALVANPYITEQQWYEVIGIEKKQGNISVNEADAIIKKLNYKSFEAEYKIMIIWLPERMNTQAANRLLKLIEEPPEKTLFFLAGNDTKRIIKTILSRAQPIHVLPIEENALVAKLNEEEEISAARAHKLAKAAAGSYSKLSQLLEDEQESNDYFERFALLMRTAYAANGLELLSWAEELSRWGREQQKSFLYYAQQMLRESFMFNRQAGDVAYSLGEEETFVQKFSPFVNPNNVEQIFQEFNIAVAHLEQNGNAKILFTDLAIKMASLIKK